MVSVLAQKDPPFSFEQAIDLCLQLLLGLLNEQLFLPIFINIFEAYLLL